MAKAWKTGDVIPLAHINELEKKAEAYDKLMEDANPGESEETASKVKAASKSKK